MGNPSPDADEIWQEEMLFFQTMTLGQKLKSSLSCFPADTWLSQALTAQSQITLAIFHLPLSKIRPCPLTGRINSLLGKQGTCCYLSSWPQAAHSNHTYSPCSLLTKSHLTSPKAGRAAGSTGLLRKVEACCKDNQAAPCLAVLCN